MANMQDSIFGQETAPVRAPILKKKLTPIPMVVGKNQDIPQEADIIPHEQEIKFLFTCTDNRMYIEKCLRKEMRQMSDLLIGLSEKFHIEISTLVEKTGALLKYMPNLYINQAMNMCIDNPEYGYSIKKSVEMPVKKQIILRRTPLC